jgi:hypothetical protein
MLASVAFIALGLAGYIAYERWHRATYPELYFYRVLHDSLKYGDPITKVRGLLGSGIAADAREVSMFAKIRDRFPSPDGYWSNDQLLVYKPGDAGLTIFLQFRDGRLINHGPREFEQYAPPKAIYNLAPSAAP